MRSPFRLISPHHSISLLRNRTAPARTRSRRSSSSSNPPRRALMWSKLALLPLRMFQQLNDCGTPAMNSVRNSCRSFWRCTKYAATLVATATRAATTGAIRSDELCSIVEPTRCVDARADPARRKAPEWSCGIAPPAVHSAQQASDAVRGSPRPTSSRGACQKGFDCRRRPADECADISPLIGHPTGLEDDRAAQPGRGACCGVAATSHLRMASTPPIRLEVPAIPSSRRCTALADPFVGSFHNPYVVRLLHRRSGCRRTPPVKRAILSLSRRRST